MKEQECLSVLVPPGQMRPHKMGDGGVLQIHLTRACTEACNNCTQGSNFGGKLHFMSVELVEKALLSLMGNSNHEPYPYIIALFGGQPTLHPRFHDICKLLQKYVRPHRRGLWTNALNGHGAICRETFRPKSCNLNVHMNRANYEEFRRTWPESVPGTFGLDSDSRHSPVFVAMKDVLRIECPACSGEGTLSAQDATAMCKQAAGYSESKGGYRTYYTAAHHMINTKNIAGFCTVCNGAKQIYDESKGWELISKCDINRDWSAYIGMFRGQIRGWFCEIAGSQSLLHQDEPNYPDTGLDPTIEHKHPGPGPLTGKMVQWWKLPMTSFAGQVRKHCHECGVPLKGYGALALDTNAVDQVSQTHASIAKPKRKEHQVEIVATPEQLGSTLRSFLDYIGNCRRPKEEVVVSSNWKSEARK